MVPVHEALASRDPRMRRPASAQHDVVLAIKEIRRIAWVELHWLESSMLLQHRASPFPNTALFSLTRKLVAVLGHRNRMPVFEAHVGPFEVDEECGR